MKRHSNCKWASQECFGNERRVMEAARKEGIGVCTWPDEEPALVDMHAPDTQGCGVWEPADGEGSE